MRCKAQIETFHAFFSAWKTAWCEMQSDMLAIDVGEVVTSQYFF